MTAPFPTRKQEEWRYADLEALQPVWAELGDIFLEMEGAGQWAGYRAMIRNGASPAAARDRMRRGRKKWSQDEGFALYLALDAAVPGWQAKVFRDQPSSAWSLLETIDDCPPPAH